MQKEIFEKIMNVFQIELLNANNLTISIEEELWWNNESILWAWINLFKYCSNDINSEMFYVLKIALKSRQNLIKIVAVEVLLKLLQKKKFQQVYFL